MQPQDLQAEQEKAASMVATIKALPTVPDASSDLSELLAATRASIIIQVDASTALMMSLLAQSNLSVGDRVAMAQEMNAQIERLLMAVQPFILN